MKSLICWRIFRLAAPESSLARLRVPGSFLLAYTLIQFPHVASANLIRPKTVETSLPPLAYLLIAATCSLFSFLGSHSLRRSGKNVWFDSRLIHSWLTKGGVRERKPFSPTYLHRERSEEYTGILDFPLCDLTLLSQSAHRDYESNTGFKVWICTMERNSYYMDSD